MHLALSFWATFLAFESPAHFQGIVLHHFYISQDTGSPVYLSAELPDADGLGPGLEQIPSLQSRLEQLAPGERLLVVKQAESHDQSALLQPVGLELHPRNFLPDQISCAFSRLFPSLLPSSDIEFYGNSIEIHTLQGDINPRCSQIKTVDGNAIPFDPTAEYESGSDGLWLIEIPPLKPVDQQKDIGSFGLQEGSNPKDLRELLAGSSYGDDSWWKFDFRPGGGGGSNLMDISLACSLLPTARKKREGDQPVLVLGNQEGVSIEVTDTQGHRWQRAYTMDEARELLKGVEDGEELLFRLQGANLVVKAGVVENLSTMCRESLERIQKSVPGIISYANGKHEKEKKDSSASKPASQVSESGNSGKSTRTKGSRSSPGMGTGNGGGDREDEEHLPSRLKTQCEVSDIMEVDEQDASARSPGVNRIPGADSLVSQSDTDDQEGMDREVCDNPHFRNLSEAVSAGNINAVERLLTAGADINEVTAQWTPLHYAAWYGHTRILHLLLQWGGDLFAVDKNKVAPIHLAAQQGHTDIVVLLLTHGVDPDIADKNGWTPLHYAAWYDQEEVAEALLKQDASVDVVTTCEGPVEHHILSAKSLDASVCYSSHDPGSKPMQKTPLCLVVQFQRRSPKVARILLEHGSNPNPLYDGMPLLFLASWYGDNELVQLLLDYGADPNCMDQKSQWTPLHAAVANNDDPEVVFSLLLHGADPGARTLEGRTVLSHAVSSGSCVSITLLLQAGADPADRDADGLLPQERTRYLVDSWNKRVISLLSRETSPGRNCYGENPLHEAVRVGDMEKIRQHLSKSPELLEEARKDGYKPLHVAILHRNDKAVALLLMAGANLSLTEFGRKSPLELAQKSACKNMVEIVRSATIPCQSRKEGDCNTLY